MPWLSADSRFEADVYRQHSLFADDYADLPEPAVGDSYMPEPAAPREDALALETNACGESHAAPAALDAVAGAFEGDMSGGLLSKAATRGDAARKLRKRAARHAVALADADRAEPGDPGDDGLMQPGTRRII